MHHLFTFRTLCTSQMFSVNDQKISYLKALNSTKTSTASSTLWRLEIISNLRICISNIDNSDLKHLILQSIILVRPQIWGGYRISDTFVPWISNTSSLLRLLVGDFEIFIQKNRTQIYSEALKKPSQKSR